MNARTDADAWDATPANYDGAYGTPAGQIRLLDVASNEWLTATKIRNLRRYDITSYQEGKDIIDGLMA